MSYLVEHFPQLRAELGKAREALKYAERKAETSGGFRKLEWLQKVKERQSRLISLERVQREVARNCDRWGLCDYKPRGVKTT